VRLKELPPPAKVIKVSKDHDYCGVTLPDETYVVDPEGSLKNVVVFVEGVTAVESPLPTERLAENDGCLLRAASPGDETRLNTDLKKPRSEAAHRSFLSRPADCV
jgi:hypothetical protein